MVTINTLNGGDITITTTPPTSPSPYFAYDSNKVITGLYQGKPNIYEEGTNIDWGTGEETPYSGWTYGGSDVVENYATAIGVDAFDDGSYINDEISPSRGITGNITFQNITSIGSYAFSCSKLTGITMPNVTSIGERAFAECINLTSVTMPNVTSIGEDAFLNCNLTNVTMPNVTHISANAFDSCNLTSVTIGSGIQAIGNAAFASYGGNSITLTIGKTVAEVQAMGTTDYYSSTNVPYSEWSLPSGSTIVCTDGTITIS